MPMNFPHLLVHQNGGVFTIAMKVLPSSCKNGDGAQAVFDAAASCLERCEVPDPPTLETLEPAGSGLVISSLVLTQHFSYPLLDILDHIQRIAPQLLGEQERHRRYQEAARSLRLRVIRAHLHLLRSLVDTGGRIVLLSDIRGFIFDVYGTDHAAAHRRSIPLVQDLLGDLVRADFTITEEAQWEWLTDLPAEDKPGRGYEVVGYIMHILQSSGVGDRQPGYIG